LGLGSGLDPKRRSSDRYLGSSSEIWDTREVLEEVSYLHFSDWPYPKPWSEYSDVTHAKLQPPCQENFQSEEDCSTRDVWNEIYLDFMQRRQVSDTLRYSKKEKLTCEEGGLWFKVHA